MFFPGEGNLPWEAGQAHGQGGRRALPLGQGACIIGGVPSRDILHQRDMPSALPMRSFPTGGVMGVNLPGEVDSLMVQLEAVLDLSDTSTRNGGLP